MEILRQASIFQLFALLVSVAPLAMAIVFAVGPNEQRLALMRPLSLAGIFAAVSGLLLGVINSFRGLAIGSTAEPTPVQFFAASVSEGLVLPFVGFACLTLAWLCVAVGMRKHP